MRRPTLSARATQMPPTAHLLSCTSEEKDKIEKKR
jgi:hypothetical protein